MKGEEETSTMNGIKFNRTTKEIEIKGSESFIESNFDVIEELLAERLGVIKTTGSTKTKFDEKPILWVEAVEPQATEAIKIPDGIETPEVALATQQDIPEARQELKVKRPPMRKYFNTLGQLIRSEDTSINKNSVVNVVEQKPTEISIASLKEKFGLPESKIGGIIRDAERQGKVRRAENGSYVWSQD
jgi:hypothetical protein